MMFGFGQHRRELLEAELLRMAGELPSLGTRGTYLVSDFAARPVEPETELQLLVIHETDAPFHRRPDFFFHHLRPRVGTHFYVFTPEEFETLDDSDPIIQSARTSGVVVDEPA